MTLEIEDVAGGVDASRQIYTSGEYDPGLDRKLNETYNVRDRLKSSYVKELLSEHDENFGTTITEILENGINTDEILRDVRTLYEIIGKQIEAQAKKIRTSH